MLHNGMSTASKSFNAGDLGHHRLVIYAVIGAMVVHALIIWFLLNRSPSQLLPLLPKQRIEVNLVAPPRPATVPTPVNAPSVPPKVRPVVTPSPKAPRVPIKRAETPLEKPVELAAKSAPVLEPIPASPVASPEKSVELPQLASTPVPVMQPVSELKPEPTSPPGFDAAYLNNPKPVYPASARRMGLEGVVILRIKVDPHGKPQDAQVINSSGSSILDKAALDIVIQHWTFVPARQGDLPVSGVVDVPIRFSLR